MYKNKDNYTLFNFNKFYKPSLVINLITVLLNLDLLIDFNIIFMFFCIFISIIVPAN